MTISGDFFEYVQSSKYLGLFTTAFSPCLVLRDKYVFMSLFFPYKSKGNIFLPQAEILSFSGQLGMNFFGTCIQS